jgi:hypothetical protein
MITTAEILESLERGARDWPAVALAWHALAALIVVALAAGLRPSRRYFGAVLSLPLFSVSAVSWTSGNAFNAVVFALLGAALGLGAFRLQDGAMQLGGQWAVLAGATMIAFGWIYPGFVEASSPLAYFYASPLGLIPCPTLSLLIGFAFVARGLDSPLWTGLLAATGVFYGLFGAWRLGVIIDGMLLVGSVALLLYAGLVLKREPTPTRTARSGAMHSGIRTSAPKSQTGGGR